jgi:hypothetical protein
VNLMVEIEVELILPIPGWNRNGIIRTRTGTLGTRDKKLAARQLDVEELQRNRVDVRAIRGDGKAAECASLAPENGAEARRAAVLGNRRKHQLTGGRETRAVELARALIGDEEESPVLDDGASQRPPELVLAQDGSRPRETVEEKVIGIECFVPKELVGVAMEFRGARFGYDADVGPAVASERCIVKRRLGLELLDAVDGGDRNSCVVSDTRCRVGQHVGRVDAVDQVAVAQLIGAVGERVLTAVAEGRAVRKADRAAWGQRRELGEVACDQRKLGNQLGVHDPAQRRSTGLQDFGLGRDRYALTLLRDVKESICYRPFRDPNGDRFPDDGLEPRL